MKIEDKKYKVYFRRNNKERYWQLEAKKSIYGFKDLLENILASTTEKKLEIKLELIEPSALQGTAR